jgi:segregation and condensation protein A
LELGARLVHIKSLALLPDAGDTETPLAELRQLNQELAEYQLFQAATGELKTRLATGQQSYVRTNIPRLAGAELPKPELDLAQLGAVFSDALARSKPASQTLTTSHRYDQAEITARLRGRLEHGKLALSEIITACHDRGEIIITFLAILELIRGDSVTVKQERSFDDMMLVATP